MSHTDPIFRDLNILPFSKLVTQRIGVLMFKYSIHVLSNSIGDLFTSNISINSYNTRNKSKLRQPRSKYEYRNFSYRGVYIWNKFQVHINIYSSYSTFSTALKTFLLSNDLIYTIT